MVKTVLLLSGGLNSSVLLWREIIARGSEVYPMIINYGHNAMRGESQAAYNIHNKLFSRDDPKLQERLAQIKPVDAVSMGQLIAWDRIARNNEKLEIPYLDAFFIEIAIAYANSINADQVSVGGSEDSQEFIDRMSQVVNLSKSKPIELRAPFSKMPKSEIVQMGKTLKVPMETTYSCYQGLRYNCGTCWACIQRKDAFRVSGILDETIYNDDPRAKKSCCG